MEESLSVLIVDDSRIMRRMVARSLALSGVTLRDIHEASDGRQALALLRVTRVDVIFADVNMPIMGGIEMVERMVADPTLARPPVVMVSTERSEPRIARLRQLGVRAYIHKPFTPEQFRAALNEVLGTRKAS
jgi:two-component system, chemotaxis family, chemotaxis protein CheY